jgi:P-type Ca2+ transporter type 2C
MADEDPLAPIPGEEALFKVENNPFAFSPGQLSKLLDPKNYGALSALGGLRGLQKGLRTSITSGLSADEEKLSGRVSFEDAQAAGSDSPGGRDKTTPLTLTDSEPVDQVQHSKSKFVDRRRVFADNRLPEKKSKSLLRSAWIPLQDLTLILLSIAAVVSLALGPYQTFGQSHKDGGVRVEWVEDVAIIVAIVIALAVGVVNNGPNEHQFVKLNKKKEDRMVKVIRSGRTTMASIFDIFVGDVMIFEPGDVLTVDGILIDGHHVACDESSATGESDFIKKTPAADVMHTIHEGRSTKKLDPFILSGSKVCEGMGTYLVTAVGVHSSYGKTLMALRTDNETTPLQYKLNVLAGEYPNLALETR